MKSNEETTNVAASAKVDDSVAQVVAKSKKDAASKATVTELENGTEVASAAEAESKKNLK